MLLRSLSPRANLTFLASFRGRPAPDVGAALTRWGLGAHLDRPLERLSAGQRRRAALARLDTEPEPVVLLDEPLADLDLDAASLLRSAVRAAVSRGQAVVLVTHLNDELDGDAARRFIVEEGRVRPA
jgi:heme exporter protein A